MTDDPMQLVAVLGVCAMLGLLTLVFALSVRGARRSIARAAVSWQQFAQARGYKAKSTLPTTPPGSLRNVDEQAADAPVVPARRATPMQLHTSSP